jgi:predicted alpha/beta hydrolase
MCPLLAYTFTDDWYCPPKAVNELLSHFASASITWYHLKPKKLD